MYKKGYIIMEINGITSMTVEFFDIIKNIIDKFSDLI